jgi:flavorubredoxin
MRVSARANNFDVAVLGTPANGFRPATEILEFISRLPVSKEKPIVLFCSYALWTGRTFAKLESELKKKGFQHVLYVKKK